MKVICFKMFDISSIILCVLSLYVLIQESTQNSLTGKRPAWMPQGRMGKRNGLTAQEDKKAAWVPQGRFGKRMQAELTDQQELASILGSDDNDYNEIMNDKRIPRMGLFQKKDFPRMGYLNKKGSGEEASLEEIKNSIDSSIIKYFNLLSRNQQSDEDEAVKRAAWVPQGRFGKRSVSKGTSQNHENTNTDKVSITDVTRHPTDPHAFCFTITQNGVKQTTQCARLNPDGTGLTPVSH